MEKETQTLLVPEAYDGPDMLRCQEYAGYARNEVNYSIGVLMTTLEASVPEGSQLSALKKLVKQEMWRLNDLLQQKMYDTFGSAVDSVSWNANSARVSQSIRDEARISQPEPEND